VNDIVFDPSGKVRAIVIGIAGSRGLGDKDVAVAPDALKIEPPLGGTRQTLDRSPTDFAQPGSTSVASSLRQADLAAAPDFESSPPPTNAGTPESVKEGPKSSTQSGGPG